MGKQEYAGGWKPGQYALYSDFGLRSMYIIKILPFEPEEGRTVRAGPLMLGYAGHEKFDPTSARAEIVNIDLYNWDSGHGQHSRVNSVGRVGFWNTSNLYHSLGDLISHEARVIYPKVMRHAVQNLRKDYGWKSLVDYGLAKWSPYDLKPTGIAARSEHMTEKFKEEIERDIRNRQPTTPAQKAAMDRQAAEKAERHEERHKRLRTERIKQRRPRLSR